MARIVIAIPHGSIDLPPDLDPPFAPHVDAAFLRRESDAWTGRIYDVDGVSVVPYRWHRFVADPNRSERQKTEGGVVPHLDFELRRLYPPGVELTQEQRNARVVRFHRPYHQLVAHAVSEEGVSFFLDAHSMAEIGPPRGPDPGERRPDAVLSNLGDPGGEPLGDGTPVSCPPALMRFAAGRLEHHLRRILAPPCGDDDAPRGTVQLNEPFTGGYGVQTHASVAQGVPGLQVELCQRLWLDAETFEPLPGRIEWMRRVVTAWCRDIEARLKTDRLLGVDQPNTLRTTWT
jgi:N-formylglutamate deformylase